MKQSADPKGRPSANDAGKPPAAIDSLLTNVSRTNPQVALGSSFSKVRISSAVSSSITGITFSESCDFAASEGTNAAALTTAVPCRTRRRATIIGEFHFGTARPPIDGVCTSGDFDANPTLAGAPAVRAPTGYAPPRARSPSCAERRL